MEISFYSCVNAYVVMVKKMFHIVKTAAPALPGGGKLDQDHYIRDPSNFKVT